MARPSASAYLLALPYISCIARHQQRIRDPLPMAAAPLITAGLSPDGKDTHDADLNGARRAGCGKTGCVMHLMLASSVYLWRRGGTRWVQAASQAPTSRQ
jgi:hypothetical protein